MAHFWPLLKDLKKTFKPSLNKAMYRAHEAEVDPQLCNFTTSFSSHLLHFLMGLNQFLNGFLVSLHAPFQIFSPLATKYLCSIAFYNESVTLKQQSGVCMHQKFVGQALVGKDLVKVHPSNFGMPLQTLMPLRLSVCKSTFDMYGVEFQKVIEAQCSFEALRYQYQ